MLKSLFQIGIQNNAYFKRAMLLSMLLITCSLQVISQIVQITSKIDTASILIGDQLQLSLSTSYNPQLYKVGFPNIADSFNHFEVVERSKIDTTFGRDENTYTQHFTITNFDSGAWRIPAFAFDIQSLQGGTSITKFSDSFLIHVNTVQVDTSQAFKPIFGIRSAKMPMQQMILYALGIALLLIALGLLIWYIRKRMKAHKKPEIQIPDKIILPHEKALQTLQQIEKEALWQHQQEKIYHTQLTDAMRTYLEEQFNIDCFEKTTTEIMYQVKRNKAFNNSRQALRTIFETADMVKFAKSKPSDDEHVRSLELAVEVVKESFKKMSDVRGQMLGDRKQEADVRGQMSDVRSQMLGDRKQEADVRGQMSDVRRQMLGDRKQQEGYRNQSQDPTSNSPDI